MLFKDSLQLVVQLLHSVSSPDQMSDVLEDLLTPQEIQEIGERIRLLQALQKNKIQRQIAEDLGISVTTVSRGARVLKYGTGTITTYLS